MSSCGLYGHRRSPFPFAYAFLHFSFKPEDIRAFSGELIDTVLTKLESAGSPEKLAENDFMMKCKWRFSRFTGPATYVTTPAYGKGVMRIIFTARQSLATTSYDQILQRLVRILGVTSKNPSNPNFDQYLFESLSGLMRQVKRGRGSCTQLTSLSGLLLCQTQRRSLSLKGSCLDLSPSYSSKMSTVSDECFRCEPIFYPAARQSIFLMFSKYSDKCWSFTLHLSRMNTDQSSPSC